MVDALIPPPWLLLSVVCVCLIAAAGVLPGLMLAARRTARLAKRSAYERCAHQLTFLGLCFGLVLVLAGLSLLYADTQGLMVGRAVLSQLAAFFPLAPWVAGVLIVSGLLSMRLRFVAVRSPASIGLAVLVTICVWALLATGVALGFAYVVPGIVPGSPQPAALPDLALVLVHGLAGQSLVAGALLLGLALAGLCTAAGLALIVQIIRRGLDDYGRDYYMLAARWCAARALWAGSGLTLALGGLAWLLRQCGDTSWPYALACAGCMLCSVLAWLSVARSENPLRWKALMLIAALGLLLAMNGFSVLAGLWIGRIPG